MFACGLLIAICGLIAFLGGFLPGVSHPDRFSSELRGTPEFAQRELRDGWESLEEDRAAVQRDAAAVADQAEELWDRIKTGHS
jgi:hypothetical protein